MAKKISDETLKLNIVINGDEAQAELVKLEEAQRKINRANKDLREEKKKLELQNKKSQAEWEQLDKKIRENNTSIDNNKKSVELLVGEKKLLEAQNQKNSQRWTELEAQIQKTNTEIAEHRAANKKLIADRNQVDQANKNTKAQWKALDREIRENNQTIKSNKARMQELQGEIGITGLTMRQLKQRATQLRFQLANMIPGTAQFKKVDAELQQINARLRQLRGNGNRAGNALSRLANGINKYFNLAASAVAVVAGITFSLQNMVEHSAKLEDAQADVMKTTGLAKESVRDLTREMDKFNTRTPRIELLKLAEEAGRLGRNSKKDVLEFVETANKLHVALGDDLGGEEAIREVGKLTEQYKIGERYSRGFGKSMEMLGSSINAVSASGSNQASYLVDYLKRLSGISDQANIAAQDQLGFAAALDESGQRVETSATAISNVIVDMFKDTSTYANIAGKSQQEFADLLKKDANEALLLFLEGLNGNNEGLTVMGQKLEELGIDGSRATSVLATLAANTDKVRTRQAQANQALEAGTSLMDEYNVKNENLAANVDKVSRALRAQFISSGLVKFLERTFSSLAELTDQTETYEQKTRNLQAALNMELQVLKNGEFTQEQRARLIGEINDEYGDYLPRLLEEKDSLSDINAIQKEMNKNMEARILYAAFEEEIAQAIKDQANAAEGLYQNEKRRQQLKEEHQLGKADITPAQYKVLQGQSDMLDMLNQQVIEKGDDAQKEIEEKYDSIFDSLGMKFEDFRKKMSGLGSTEEADVPSGGESGSVERSEKEVAARERAMEQIQSVLRKAAGEEDEIVRAKYKKLIELAEKHKIDVVDELTEAMNAEIIDKIQEQTQKEWDEADKKNEEKLRKQEEFEKKRRELLDKYGMLTDEDKLLEELDMLQEFYDEGLLKHEEFLQAKAFIEDQYSEEQKAQNREGWDQRLRNVGTFTSAFSDLVGGMRDMELASIEEVDRRDFEVTQKRGETDEEFQKRREEAEKKYTRAVEDQERARHEVAKEYAVLQAMADVSQIAVSTATAIMQAFAQLGPIAGAVAAGILGATGAVQAGIAIKEANKIRSLDSGQYDVIDQHGDRYRANRNEELPTGLYTRPTASLSKNMLVAEKRPEIVVDGLTTKRLIQFHPEVLETINSVRHGRRVQSYSEGNYPRAEGAAQASGVATDPQLAAAMNRLGSAIDNLVSKGVNANIGDRDIRKVRDRMHDFEKIERTYDHSRKRTG